jgi:uncharacterized protein YjbI with pentapeptide repeats
LRYYDVNIFLNHYLPEEKLDYNKLVETYSLVGDEITNPMLLSMFCQVFPEIKEDLILLNPNKIDSRIIRTFIYFYFINFTVHGKNPKDNLMNKEYVEEKSTLRNIAYLRHLHNGIFKVVIKSSSNSHSDSIKFEYTSDDLDLVKGLNQVKNMSNNTAQLIDGHLNEKIVDTYFRFDRIDFNNVSKEIAFIHQSFEDYLNAENFFNRLLNENEQNIWMNIEPNDGTLEFLKGLIAMLYLSGSINTKYIRNINKYKITLLNSFDYPFEKDPKFYIKNNCMKNIQDDQVLVFSTRHLSDNRNQDRVIQANDLPNNKYENLVVYKWISLFAINYINETKLGRIAIKPEEISKLIVQTGDFISPKLKIFHVLNKMNLSGANL